MSSSQANMSSSRANMSSSRANGSIIQNLTQALNTAAGELVPLPPSIDSELYKFTNYGYEFCTLMKELLNIIAQHLGIKAEECEHIQTASMRLVKRILMLLEETYEKILELSIVINIVHIKMQTSELDEESDESENAESEERKKQIEFVNKSMNNMRAKLWAVRKTVYNLTDKTVMAAGTPPAKPAKRKLVPAFEPAKKI